MGDKEHMKTVNMKEVTMSAPAGVNWWSYFTNVIKLSPVVPGEKGVPEGVMRLGATYVLRSLEGEDGGLELLFKHEDRLPGDHPDIKEVEAAVLKFSKD